MTSRTLRNFTCALSLTALAGVAITAHAQHPSPVPVDGSPNQAPNPDWSRKVVDDGKTSIYKGPTTHHPQTKPFQTSEPGNMLPTIYEPMVDSGGDPIPNSLPSTPADPFNLHPEPEVSEIDPRSPRWDLGMIIHELKAAVNPEFRREVNKQVYKHGTGVPPDPRRGRVERKGNDAGTTERLNGRIDFDRVQFAIDILEGNPIDRTYSGMSLLKYKGPDMVKKVDPETNTVTVHQSWQRSRIMSDTMFIDPSTIPADEEWTIRYVVDSLHWGHEDFAPFAVFFDDPQDTGKPNKPFFQMDQTFFPMEQGHRYVFEIAMPPHRFWNLTYTWGWRVHPPRIQAIEKALKAPGGKNIVKWESDVFGKNPTASRENKLQAISMISDLAPAKRMWKAFRAIKASQSNSGMSPGALRELVAEAEAAYEDWKNRHKLPRGIERADPEEYDETIVYLNNMMYGGISDQSGNNEQSFFEWQTRGEKLKVKLKNGDYFPHFYMNVDFGGRRGWENIYQNTVALGGQGPWFTFGRTQWWQNLGDPNVGENNANRPVPAMVPAAKRPTGGSGPGGSGAAQRVTTSTNGLTDLEQRIGYNLPEVPTGPGHSVPPMAKVPEERSDSWEMAHPGKGVKLHRQRSEAGLELGIHNVELLFRHDPSRRIRFYQFDPMHHNENILSIH